MTGGALLAGPTHVDDDRGITAGIPRQNAQTSLKGASAICHRSDGAVPTRSVRFMHTARTVGIGLFAPCIKAPCHALFWWNLNRVSAFGLLIHTRGCFYSTWAGK